MLRRVLRHLSPTIKCHIDSLKPQSIDQAPSILNNYGVVILPRRLLKSTFAIDWESLEREIQKLNSILCADILDIKQAFNADIMNGQLDPRQASKDAKEGRTYIHERGSYFFDKYSGQWCDIDNGIIDIFNICPFLENYPVTHEFLNSLKLRCKAIIENIGEYVIDNEQSYTNAYIYKEVSSPRSLHVDSYSTQFKVFFPMCNIHSIANGPISYVPKSHHGINLKKAQLSSIYNKFFGSDIGGSKNDASLFGIQESLPILTSLGDVVIGNQSCVHGDLPYKGQSSLSYPYQKVVIVSNLFPSKQCD